MAGGGRARLGAGTTSTASCRQRRTPTISTAGLRGGAGGGRASSGEPSVRSMTLFAVRGLRARRGCAAALLQAASRGADWLPSAVRSNTADML